MHPNFFTFCWGVAKEGEFQRKWANLQGDLNLIIVGEGNICLIMLDNHCTTATVCTHTELWLEEILKKWKEDTLQLTIKSICFSDIFILSVILDFYFFYEGHNHQLFRLRGLGYSNYHFITLKGNETMRCLLNGLRV